MFDYDVTTEYLKNQYNSVESTLKKVAELLAFIKVYGSIYNDYYYRHILNINNIMEHYLKNLDHKIIDKLYEVYSTAKNENKSEREIFEELRIVLYNFSSMITTDVIERRKSHI